MRPAMQPPDHRFINARRFGLTITAIAASLSPSALSGQPTSPEAAARLLVETVKTADWDGMARLMHPEALAELRGFLDPLLDMAGAVDFREAVLGVKSSADARQLSDQEVFAGFVRFAMTQDPELVPSMRTAELEVVGHLMEDETAHVVSRITISYQGITISRMEVSSFRELNGRWLGLLTGDISAMAKALREAAQAGGAG